MPDNGPYSGGTTRHVLTENDRLQEALTEALDALKGLESQIETLREAAAAVLDDFDRVGYWGRSRMLMENLRIAAGIPEPPADETKGGDHVV